MAIVPIRTFGDPVLRQRAQEVERLTDLHRRVARDMIDTMRAAPGVGLAAPQIGVMERIFVWEVDDRSGVVINPVITWRSDVTVEGEEGCLSLPGLYYPVIRAAEVRVEGLDDSGDAIVLEAEELLARVVQHEVDHLDGVLFIDHLSMLKRNMIMRRLQKLKKVNA